MEYLGGYMCVHQGEKFRDRLRILPTTESSGYFAVELLRDYSTQLTQVQNTNLSYESFYM